MTREQQKACRELQLAEENYLRAYGWEAQGSGWRHPKVAPILRAYCLRDAVHLTRADPRLGWP